MCQCQWQQLTFAEVGVNAHVSCGAREALVLAIRNVLVCLCVDVFLEM